MTTVPWATEQVDAITATGHRLLEANAGSGKTTTVVGKILWHLGIPLGVDENNVPVHACPEHLRLSLDQIGAITFTEKAAYDLARKLRAEIRRHAPHLLWDIDRATIGTIHSFCGNLLKEHSLRFGVDPAFHVLDDRETRLELKAVAKEVVLEAAERGEESARQLLARYDLEAGSDYSSSVVDFLVAMTRDLRWHRERYQGWTSGDGIDWGRLEALAGGGDPKDRVTAELCDALVTLGRRVVDRWEGYLADENLKDFDALILDCRDRLRDPNAMRALASIRSRYRLLIIDEFQDTDSAQRDIAFRIAGLDGSDGGVPGPQLFLVGDPKQSIYGFRGADIAVWNEVVSTIGKPFQLSRNYRSVPEVINYVNRAAGPVITEVGKAATAERVVAEPETAVAWVPLIAGRAAGATSPLEWLVTTEDKADDRRAQEADLVATRIRDLVVDHDRGDLEGADVIDPDTGQRRSAEYRDVAILFRASTGVEIYAAALARWGVPYYLAGNLGLSKQLELEDLLNLFRLVANPLDDLAAFAWMRSPFVGLRDEVLTRIRLEAGRRPLLYAARGYLEKGAWFPAPEHADIVTLEQAALSQGLSLIEDLETLKSRVPLDQLALLALERSGYPLHIQLLDQPLPRLANLQRFVRMLEAYRGHTVGSFLELWDEWKSEDVGLPQAPLYSKRDNVVTLSTVHAAKGLEWPIVVLADLSDPRDRSANSVWSDRTLGPILALKQADRGLRATKLCRRKLALERAEEARLFYVAATRARDRLIVTGPSAPDKPRGEWAWRGCTPEMSMTREIMGVAPLPPAPEPDLKWLGGIVPGGERSRLARPVNVPTLQFTRSATELMTRARSGRDHRLRYLHGVQPPWRFAIPEHDGPASPPSIRADVKGTLVHAVLERIQDEAEIEALLDVVVGSVDADDLTVELSRDTELRKSIEDEIRRVVTSQEWRWYVEGTHWRELGFVQFRSPRRWRIGAMDLFRAGPPALIVDFKTQDIPASAAGSEAGKYRLQALTYRQVYQSLAAGSAAVHFHFTGPGTSVLG